MPTPIMSGTTAPIFQNWEVQWSPTAGGNLTEKYLGLDISQMLTLAGVNAAAGVTCKLKYSNNVAELELSSSDPAANGFASVFSSITDKWEVGVDQEKPELFENSNFLSLFTGPSASYGVNADQQFAQLIKKIAENGSSNGTGWGNFCDAFAATNFVSGSGAEIPAFDTGTYDSSMDEAYANLSTPNWYATGIATPTAMLKFFCEEYFRGRTNYVHGKYVLKHSTLAPCNYSASVAEFNIEKIYSISQLLSEAQSSSLWILPLPAYLAYKILGYPVPVNMPPGYQWGALKMRSNAIVAARGRIEISQEYLIDAIAVPTYGLK